MTTVFRKHAILVGLNGGALNHPAVEVVHRDAFEFLKTTQRRFNAILIDLPDPKNPSPSKLYTRSFFYALAARRLTRDGVLATQATSPVYAREVLWSIARTLAAVPDPYRSGKTLEIVPYRAYVPSYGDGGIRRRRAAQARLALHSLAIGAAISRPSEPP